MGQNTAWRFNITVSIKEATFTGQETIQITSEIDGIDSSELKEQLEQKLAGSGIKLELRRSTSSDRFDFGLILAVLVGAAKVAPLITAIAGLMKSRRPAAQIKLLANDGTTILEVPADTSVERIEELLRATGENKRLKAIRVV
jgi:hypothetical protein